MGVCSSDGQLCALTTGGAGKLSTGAHSFESSRREKKRLCVSELRCGCCCCCSVLVLCVVKVGRRDAYRHWLLCVLLLAVTVDTCCGPYLTYMIKMTAAVRVCCNTIVLSEHLLCRPV